MEEREGVRKVVGVARDVGARGGWIVVLEAGRERQGLRRAGGSAQGGMGVSGMREMEEERRGDFALACGVAVGASLRLRRLREGVAGGVEVVRGLLFGCDGSGARMEGT